MENKINATDDQLLLEAFNLAQQGKSEQSGKIFDTLFSKGCSNTDDYKQLIKLALKLKKSASAIELLSPLLHKEPENPNLLDQLAQALIQNSQYTQALQKLHKALTINPSHTDALINTGIAYNSLKKYEQALPFLEKAKAIAPDNNALLVDLAVALNMNGRHDEALSVAESAKKRTPNDPAIFSILGNFYSQLGQKEAAIQAYEDSISLNDSFGLSYYGLAELKKFTASDAEQIKLFESKLNNKLSLFDRFLLHFSLGKAYDDIHDWDTAFHHFKKANLLKKQAVTPEQPLLLKKCMVDFYRTFSHENLKKPDPTLPTPIFIVGMPRTGSTLIEQILCTNEGISSIGESGYITKNIVIPLFGSITQPKLNTELTNLKALQAFANNYYHHLQQAHPDSKFVINKSPGNFFFLGLIKALFPDAIIIHSIRNPMDTCLACFIRPFDTLAWTYDLEWIADCYNFYQNCMSTWEETFAKNTILNMTYEDFIDNSEHEGKRLMAFCGIQWNPECLQFFTKKDRVMTASLWQVRQPLYKSAKYRWHNYAKHLGILAQKIKPFLSKEDIDLLESNGIRIQKTNFLKKLAKIFQ